MPTGTSPLIFGHSWGQSIQFPFEMAFSVCAMAQTTPNPLGGQGPITANMQKVGFLTQICPGQLTFLPVLSLLKAKNSLLSSRKMNKIRRWVGQEKTLLAGPPPPGVTSNYLEH